MRVVVIGATGNVGTCVIKALGEAPEVDAIVGVARRIPQWTPAKTEWVAADITNDDLAPVLRGADVVVALAWAFQPSHNPIKTWQTNVLGNIRILEAAATSGTQALIYASSVGAYSPGPKSPPVTESYPTHGWPLAAYTREKAYVERMLDTFEKEHPECRVVRLRTAFIFQRGAAHQQRRIFGGPFVPARLIRPGAIPFVPDIPGMSFQALHSADAGVAYRSAILSDVRGPFNIAADPIIDAQQLAELLNAKTVRISPRLARMGIATAWNLRLMPSSPYLFDAALRLPIMDITRARMKLQWSPKYSAVDALRELLDGLRDKSALPTPALQSPMVGSARRPQPAQYT